MGCQVAELAFQRTKLLRWLLGRVRQREFDSNKQYASEVLAILLQSSPTNQQALVDADGIELLLQVGCYSHLCLVPTLPLMFCACASLSWRGVMLQ